MSALIVEIDFPALSHYALPTQKIFQVLGCNSTCARKAGYETVASIL
jgi:hypothetical protein